MKAERAALGVVVTLLGMGAGWISLSHVYTFVMRYSPESTHWSTGVILAAVSELMPVGVLLYVRVQRGNRLPVHPLAWWLLVGAGAFSLTAQWATAEPSIFGWIIAGAATLAFMGLCKLMLGSKAKPVAVQPARTLPQTERPAPRKAEVARPEPVGDDKPEPVPPTPEPRATTNPAPTSRTARAERIVDARRKLGPDATQIEVGAMAGCSASTVSRFEAKHPGAHLTVVA